jgi:hypothetical protein
MVIRLIKLETNDFYPRDLAKCGNLIWRIREKAHDVRALPERENQN